MAIDLGKYLQLYFEESTEGLSQLAGLLQDTDLQGEAHWHEAVRVAHSVKGNSGAFGFCEIELLARELEQVLLRVERGEITMDSGLRRFCIEAVAGLQMLVQRRRTGLSGDAALAAAMGARLAAGVVEKAAAGG